MCEKLYHGDEGCDSGGEWLHQAEKDSRTIKQGVCLVKESSCQKRSPICASIIWSGCQQSAGWNIEVHDSLESATGEKAGRPTEYHALIEDVSASPCRYFTWWFQVPSATGE